MPRWLLTLLRLTPAVASASALSIVGLIAFRQIVPLSELEKSSNEVGNYLQTLGGIYAVLLAFVVYVVWGQFNDARGTVDREAASLVDLHRTVSGLAAHHRAEIQVPLRAYIDAVLAEEWPAMAKRDEVTIERVGEHLDQVWLAIHRTRPNGDCQNTIYGEVLRQFNDLSDLRTNRLTTARARIPQAMKILLYTGAVLTTGSMYLLAIDRLWIHAAVTAALAGAIAHILYLIADLDDTYAGDWQVAKAPFERARKHCDRATHLVDA